jgi:hypothetical protein
MFERDRSCECPFSLLNFRAVQFGTRRSFLLCEEGILCEQRKRMCLLKDLLASCWCLVLNHGTGTMVLTLTNWNEVLMDLGVFSRVTEKSTMSR